MTLENEQVRDGGRGGAMTGPRRARLPLLINSLLLINLLFPIEAKDREREKKNDQRGKRA